MQLLVKLYSEKPSRIAIQYSHEYQAVKAYEDLIKKFGNDPVRIKFELNRDKITLSLQSDHNGLKIIYKDLEFRNDQIKSQINFINNKNDFIFVHIYAKANKLFVAKAFHQVNFIKVAGLDLFGDSHTFNSVNN